MGDKNLEEKEVLENLMNGDNNEKVSIVLLNYIKGFVYNNTRSALSAF